MVKNLPANAGDIGDLGSIPGSGRSGEGMATYSSILPGESHGQRSLAGCRPWGCTPIQMKQLNTHACKGPL